MATRRAFDALSEEPEHVPVYARTVPGSRGARATIREPCSEYPERFDQLQQELRLQLSRCWKTL